MHFFAKMKHKIAYIKQKNRKFFILLRRISGKAEKSEL